MVYVPPCFGATLKDVAFSVSNYVEFAWRVLIATYMGNTFTFFLHIQEQK